MFWASLNKEWADRFRLTFFHHSVLSIASYWNLVSTFSYRFWTKSLYSELKSFYKWITHFFFASSSVYVCIMISFSIRLTSIQMLFVYLKLNDRTNEPYFQMFNTDCGQTCVSNLHFWTHFAQDFRFEHFGKGENVYHFYVQFSCRFDVWKRLIKETVPQHKNKCKWNPI